jgi:hypothetical protein
MTVSVARFRLSAAAVLGVLALTGCSAPAPQGDYPAYSSSAELIDKADLVVRGVALRSRTGKLLPDAPTGTDPLLNPQAGLPTAEADAAREAGAVDVTITTVRVDEVFKGTGAPGDLIEVSRPTGEKALPAAESGCVLFLAAYGPGIPHSLLNPDALYLVADGGTLTPGGSGTPPLATIDELKSAVHP